MTGTEEAREAARERLVRIYDGYPVEVDYASDYMFDAGVREGIRMALAAVEKRRPEMGPNINITQYREGLNDGVYRALAAIDALEADHE